MTYKIVRTVCTTETHDENDERAAAMLEELTEVNGDIYVYDSMYEVAEYLMKYYSVKLNKVATYNMIKDCTIETTCINIMFYDDMESKFWEHPSFRVMYAVVESEDATVYEPLVKFMDCSKRSRK